jgi:hypothetical protein
MAATKKGKGPRITRMTRMKSTGIRAIREIRGSSVGRREFIDSLVPSYLVSTEKTGSKGVSGEASR